MQPARQNQYTVIDPPIIDDVFLHGRTTRELDNKALNLEWRRALRGPVGWSTYARRPLRPRRPFRASLVGARGCTEKSRTNLRRGSRGPGTASPGVAVVMREVTRVNRDPKTASTTPFKTRCLNSHSQLCSYRGRTANSSQAGHASHLKLKNAPRWCDHAREAIPQTLPLPRRTRTAGRSGTRSARAG